MVTATKEFQWAMAHMLANHHGLCRNLHGHEYKLLVTVATDDGEVQSNQGNNSSGGMVVDFSNIKLMVQDLIVDKLDHATMIWKNTTSPLETELGRLLRRYQSKVVEVPYRPTAENMAKDFYYTLKAYLPCQIVKVRLYETPTSYAEYSE